MTIDIKAKIAAAKKTGPDMNVAAAGGSNDPIAVGKAPARLVGYYEIGQHETEYEGRKTVSDWVQLVFELSGPKHPLRNGEPVRIKLEEKLSLSEKANFYKLFGAMNYAGKATHMAEFVGDAFIVEVFHNPSADGKRIFPSLKGKAGKGYNITGPTYEDPATGETKLLEVAQPVSPLKVFFWEDATKEDWDNIYTAGEWAERKDEKTGEVISPAKSKNVIQARIKEAVNWNAHPLKAILEAGGDTPDIPDAETPERDTPANDAAADPLASLG